MKNILDKTYKGIVGKKLLYQVFCCISPTAMGIHEVFKKYFWRFLILKNI